MITVKTMEYRAEARVVRKAATEDEALEKLIEGLNSEIKAAQDRLRANQRSRDAIAP